MQQFKILVVFEGSICVGAQKWPEMDPKPQAKVPGQRLALLSRERFEENSSLAYPAPAVEVAEQLGWI